MNDDCPGSVQLGVRPQALEKVTHKASLQNGEGTGNPGKSPGFAMGRILEHPFPLLEGQ